MIVVIDGTGPADDAEYAREMGGSFCSQIAAQAGGRYFRGPSLTGSQVSSIADRAAGEAMSGDRGEVILVGYSRGGCTAILTARRLRDRGVRVKSMFLFDAVDMQVSDLHLSQFITDNVDFVAHARSARSLGFWAHNPVKSRFYFVNTGRWLSGSGHMEEKSFTGTHGAVGGCPWGNIGGDAACAMAVADWMNGQLKSRGVQVTLKA